MTPDKVAVPLKLEWMKRGSFHATELMEYCLDSLEVRYPDAEWTLEAIQPEDFLAWFRLRQ
jgi:hypothetical protein